MAHDLGQLARHGTVHVFDDIEVCRKEDIKIPLVNLDVIMSESSNKWERVSNSQMALSPVPSVSDTVFEQQEHSDQAQHREAS